MNAVTPLRRREPATQMPATVSDAYEAYALAVRKSRAALADGRSGRGVQVALDLAAGRAWGRFLLLMAKDEGAGAQRASTTDIAKLVRAFNKALREANDQSDELDDERTTLVVDLENAIRRAPAINMGDMTLKLLMAVAGLAEGHCLNSDAAAEMVAEARQFGLEVEVA